MRRLLPLLLAIGCGHPPAGSPGVPEAELALEVAPASLGARPPGDPPAITVALVNRSSTRSFAVPRPGRDAWLGARAPLRYVYERARAGGGWEPLPDSFFVPHDTVSPDQPGERIVLGPGQRAALAGNLPPLAFPDDLLGRLRARLVYDVDAELARLPRPGTRPIGVVATSNPIDVDQVAGPVELVLESLGPVVAGAELDPRTLFRITARNRSSRDITVHGPGGITAAVGFQIFKPNGGVWPKGERPVMGLAPEPAKPVVLRPGQTIEIYGPHPALGETPGTWTYPAAETFRIRALLSQPGPQRMHYSSWVTITSVAR